MLWHHYFSSRQFSTFASFQEPTAILHLSHCRRYLCVFVLSFLISVSKTLIVCILLCVTRFDGDDVVERKLGINKWKLQHCQFHWPQEISSSRKYPLWLWSSVRIVYQNIAILFLHSLPGKLRIDEIHSWFSPKRNRIRKQNVYVKEKAKHSKWVTNLSAICVVEHRTQCQCDRLANVEI